MKRIRGGILFAIAVLVALTIGVVYSRKPTSPHPVAQRNDIREHPLSPDVLQAINELPPAELIKATPTPRSFTKRTADFTNEERAKLAKDFAERYRPVVEKWFNAYAGRIPFRLEDFTLDKFHSRLGDYMFTFMIGDVTFTVQDNPKLGLKVSYLMTRQGVRQLNQVPQGGFVPDLSVPTTREEVLRMVKEDTGVEFKPNEVLIKPTAAACALNGGAFVDILPAGKDPNNAMNYNISMVFDSAGKLVNYTRHPFF